MVSNLPFIVRILLLLFARQDVLLVTGLRGVLAVFGLISTKI
jgi:hypothetical protein